MNPFEAPETYDASPHKPVKRLSAVLVILILIMAGMFGFGVWRSYTARRAAQWERQRAQEQQLLEQELREKWEAEKP